MGTFEGILGDSVKVTRRSSFMVAVRAVAASPAIEQQPARPVLLRVWCDAPVGGTVQLAGDSVEAVTFSAGERRSKQTSALFASLAAVTVQGLTGGTFSIEAIAKTGEPILTDKLVSASLSVKWYVISANRIRFTRKESGQVPVADFRMMAVWNADIQNGDLVAPVGGAIAGLTLGTIIGVYKIGAFDGTTHHLEADVRRI